jgi:branched-chain amino acid transport system substrate-binding protein
VASKKHDKVIIGAIMPLTGDVASYGIAIKNGVSLAVEQLNAAGGIRGRNIEIIYEDDKADPKTGVLAAQKLIFVDKVPAIIGAVASGVTLAVAPICESNKVILLSPASSSPKLTSAGEFIFRNYPSDELEGNLVAKFAIARKYYKAAVLTANTEYGVGLNKVFSDEFTHIGGKILFNERYAEGTTDFRTSLTKIKQANTDCIFIVGYSRELGTLVKQARELGITKQFLSTVNFYDAQSIITGGAAVDGTIFSSPVFDPKSTNPVMSDFVKAFKSAYGLEPDVWSAHGYDAMKLLAVAMQHNGLQPTHIKEGLHAITDYPGVSGNTSFDKNGDVIKPARFLTVSNGQFVPLQTQ